MVDNILVWCGSWSTRDNKGPAAEDLYVSCDIYILFVCPASPVMIYHGRGSCIYIYPWIRVVSHLFEDGIIPFLDGYAVIFHGCFVYIVMWSWDCLADEKISVMSCVTNSSFSPQRVCESVSVVFGQCS